jgi:hypothetical protein
MCLPIDDDSGDESCLTLEPMSCTADHDGVDSGSDANSLGSVMVFEIGAQVTGVTLGLGLWLRFNT